MKIGSLCMCLLVLFLFSGTYAQVSVAQTPLLVSEASFSTVQGGKHVSVSSEGDLEIADAPGSAGRTLRAVHYSSVNIFLYMIPLGAQDGVAYGSDASRRLESTVVTNFFTIQSA